MPAKRCLAGRQGANDDKTNKRQTATFKQMKQNAMTTIRSFLETSSIHGVHYLAEGGPLWQRVYWLLGLICGIVLASIVISQSASNWEVTYYIHYCPYI